MTKLVAMLAAVLAGSASAQWAQEPKTVMGIELGAPKASLPQCPSGSAAFSSPVPCLEESKFQPELGTVWGLPLNFILGGGTAVLVDGRIAQIHVTVRRDESYARLKAILVERYGPPHSAKLESVTANSGAVLTSEECTWTGKNVLIMLSERSDMVDRSLAAFSYRPLASAKRADEESERKQDASKL